MTILIALVTTLLLSTSTYAQEDVLSLSPITSAISPAPSVTAILPSTGGVPGYLYTPSRGPSVLLQPGQLPTFMYPNASGSTTVIVPPNQAPVYLYHQRSK